MNGSNKNDCSIIKGKTNYAFIIIIIIIIFFLRILLKYTVQGIEIKQELNYACILVNTTPHSNAHWSEKLIPFTP